MTKQLRLCSYTIKDYEFGMDMTRKEIIAAKNAIFNIEAKKNPEKIYTEMMDNTGNKELVLVGDKSIDWFIKKLGILSETQKTCIKYILKKNNTLTIGTLEKIIFVYNYYYIHETNPHAKIYNDALTKILEMNKFINILKATTFAIDYINFNFVYLEKFYKDTQYIDNFKSRYNNDYERIEAIKSILSEIIEDSDRDRNINRTNSTLCDVRQYIQSIVLKLKSDNDILLHKTYIIAIYIEAVLKIIKHNAEINHVGGRLILTKKTKSKRHSKTKK